jgi:hypothetical protein
MSAVDVLAVIDDAATWVGPDEDALREARAAVAGLYDEALKACAFLDGIGRHDRTQPLREAAHRIRTPAEDLARMQGGES